jgi:hypothetical protein
MNTVAIFDTPCAMPDRIFLTFLDKLALAVAMAVTVMWNTRPNGICGTAVAMPTIFLPINRVIAPLAVAVAVATLPTTTDCLADAVAVAIICNMRTRKAVTEPLAVATPLRVLEIPRITTTEEVEIPSIRAPSLRTKAGWAVAVPWSGLPAILCITALDNATAASAIFWTLVIIIDGMAVAVPTRNLAIPLVIDTDAVAVAGTLTETNRTKTPLAVVVTDSDLPAVLFNAALEVAIADKDIICTLTVPTDTTAVAVAISFLEIPRTRPGIAVAVPIKWKFKPRCRTGCAVTVA